VRKILLHIVFIISFSCFSQETDSLRVSRDSIPFRVATLQEPLPEYDPLAPSRAAFYSAVLPGLGQIYNKRYWKVPIVYGGIATSIYFYSENRTDYNRFRNAYKRRLAGFKDDEFYGNGNEPLISNDRLINAQRTAQKNMSMSLMVAVGIYLLNIIDANVDAHLKQYDVREDLSLRPKLDIDPISNQTHYGFSLRFQIH
jgi:hypothetical protein